MSRRGGPALGSLVLLLLTACGGNPPTVRNVDAVSSGSETAREAVGAKPLDPTESTAPPTTANTAEARLLEGAPDLIDGLFAALRDNDFDRAARFTSGPALQLLTSLQTNVACGLGISDASVGEPKDVTIARKGQYEVAVESSMTMSTGVQQRFDAVAIEEADDGSWRVFDILSKGSSIASNVRSPIAPETEADWLRVVLVDACYGPDRVHGTVDLTTSSEYRMPFVDVFLRLPNGDQVRPVDGLGGLADPIPKLGTRRYTFDFQRQGLGPRAELVLVSIDAETKSAGQPRERVYPMTMPAIFAEPVQDAG